MEHSTDSKKDSKESIKSKKRRSPEDIGALVITSEREARTSRPSPEKPLATGHVGAAALLAEAKPARSAANPAPESAQTGKHVETVPRAELLSLSEKVMVDGSSLHQIYETHLVGEQGLRRLMAEHIRGGDLKKALRREIVERQIDFERDPAVRDMTIPVQLSASQGSSDSGKAALDKLLKQTDLALGTRNEETAFFKARAIYEANQLQQHKQRRQIIDISVAAVILILLTLLIGLYMSRT